ncbi:MAG: hypothetical protein RL595_2350 [Planctomycetota bacterium]|jgi:Methane oxygenase PmoA
MLVVLSELMTSLPRDNLFMRQILISCFTFLCFAVGFSFGQDFSFTEKPGSIQFLLNNKPLLEYVYEDKDIARPYFARVHAGNGNQITRSHPPVQGVDPADHATMHPGIWLSFGDVNGKDYWRNKAKTLHKAFLVKPELKGASSIRFHVENHYLDGLETGSNPIMKEKATYTIQKHNHAWSLKWESEFSAMGKELTFGDQEEFGLGVRVNTPMTVKKGGRITSSEGGVDEKGTWGRPARWMDYTGKLNGKDAGITLVSSTENPRGSWFHTRDYGLMVANLFARKAFTKKDADPISIKPDQNLRMGYLLIMHDGPLPPADFLEKIIGQSGLK